MRHSGARAFAGEPGIQSHISCRPWIPGPLLGSVPE